MIIYVWKGDYRSYGFSSDLWGGNNIAVTVPENFAGGNKVYDPDTKTWVVDEVIPEDPIQVATSIRDNLVDEAIQYISDKQYQGKAARNRLTEAEGIMYDNILDYIDELEALDLTVEEIEWPKKPF